MEEVVEAAEEDVVVMVAVEATATTEIITKVVEEVDIDVVSNGSRLMIVGVPTATVEEAAAAAGTVVATEATTTTGGVTMVVAEEETMVAAEEEETDAVTTIMTAGKSAEQNFLRGQVWQVALLRDCQ